MQQPVTREGVVEVREATRRDLRATARLHHRYLPTGFFARLGRAFLRTYHGSFLASPLAAALVVTGGEDDGPAGFLVGTLKNRLHYRWVLRHRSVALTARLVLALACRPRLAWVFARTRVRRYLRWIVRYPFRRGDQVSAPPDEGTEGGAPDHATEAPPTVAVLTHVVVDGSLQGAGAGRQLVEAFVARAREAGASEVRLVTDVDGGASAFYERLGWRAVDEHRGLDGKLVREFRLPLLGPDA